MTASRTSYERLNAPYAAHPEEMGGGRIETERARESGQKAAVQDVQRKDKRRVRLGSEEQKHTEHTNQSE